MRLQELFVKFQHLDEWVKIYGFNVSSPGDKKFNPSISYVQPDPINLVNNSRFRIYLWFRAKGPSYVYKEEMTITQSIYFNIHFKRKQSIEKVMELNKKIQDFFSLAMSTPVATIEMGFRKDSLNAQKKKGVPKLSGNIIYPDPVRASSDKVSIRDMLISYESMKEGAENFLELWLQMYEEMSPVIRLYMDTRTNPSISKHTRFLNLIFALEAYHKNKINAQRQNLTPRLNDLLKRHSYLTKYFYKTRESFVNRIVKSRNYFVHNGDVDKRYLIKEDKLNEYSFKMRLLLEAILLTEMGFPKKTVYERIKSVHQYSVFMSFK